MNLRQWKSRIGSRFFFAAPAAALAAVAIAGSPAPAAAQELPELRTARNAVYVELLGNAVLYSINYERFLTENASARVGAMLFAATDSEGNSGAAVAAPLMVNYLVGRGSHRLETGVGLGLASIAYDGVTSDPDDFYENRVFGTATLGYRYQPVGGGLLLKAGVTPLFNQDGVAPMVGASIGYAF